MIQRQKQIDFARIRKAIGYLSENYKSQPTLEQAAEHVNLSSYHFQRMFSNWAGISPKQFLKYINITHAKKLLKEDKASLLDTTYELGLSSTSRLHDLFIDIEGMTPGEYKNGGENLSINYSFVESPFGKTIVASTIKGICYIAFVNDEESSLKLLKNQYPNAEYQKHRDQMQQMQINLFLL